MSITAYVGLPGSGKSYAVVEHQILPALRAGRHVVTNVPMNMDLVRSEIPSGTIEEIPLEVVSAEPDRIFEFATNGCVLVLDELWKLFPAGQKVTQVPEAYKRLLAEHRHMVDAAGNSMQIVFVTQDLGQIAAFAKMLVEQTFAITKLSSFGFSKKFRVDVFHGAVTGPRPPLGKRQREMYGSYKPEVYRFYKSHTMSQSGEAGANETKIDRRGVIWKQPIFWLGMPACLALLVGGVWYVYSFFHPEAHAPKPGSAVGGAPVRPPGPGVPFSSSPAAQLPAAIARVSGYVEFEGAPELSLVFLTDGAKSWTIRFGDSCSFHRHREIRCVWEGRTYSASGSPYVPPELKGVG